MALPDAAAQAKNRRNYSTLWRRTVRNAMPDKLGKWGLGHILEAPQQW